MVELENFNKANNSNNHFFWFTIPLTSLDSPVPRPGPYLFQRAGVQNYLPHYNPSQVVPLPGVRGGGVGTPGNSWWRCATKFSKSWSYFRWKNVIFHTRPLKSIPVFRPGLWAEIMLSLLRLERKQTSNPFQICIFLFLYYSFGIETINMFIHSRSSLENHTRFQTKMGKVYTRFQTKTAQKPYPMGRHIPMLKKRVPLPALLTVRLPSMPHPSPSTRSET